MATARLLQQSDEAVLHSGYFHLSSVQFKIGIYVRSKASMIMMLHNVH